MDTDATGNTTTRIELVGTPRLVLGDASIHPLERKDAALLALLAIDGPLPRGRAAALLWPDVDGDAARNNLRQRLHRLRRRAGHDLVLTERDVLHLAPQAGADLPAHDPCASHAAQAELLGAFDYDDCEALRDWVAIARARLRDDRRNARTEAAARFEREGQIAQALPLAEQLLADDPLIEHAHRRVMRLHYLRGDRAAALAAFQRCRTVLAQQLRAAPGKETLELAALIEKSEALSSPAANAPRPVAVLRPPRLVGRDAELHALDQAWWQRRVALLFGEPGVGKSRLLNEFAAAHGGLLVGARPGDPRVPYATLARLLRALRDHAQVEIESWAQHELARIVPEFDTEWVATGDVSAARLAHAVELQLAAVRNATHGNGSLNGLVIDDLQFADAESVGVLALVVRSDRLALAWLFGARGHPLPPVAQPWVSAADAAALVQMHVRPLDEAGTRELLQSLELRSIDAQRWAPGIYRHTGGNPMFVLETLGALLAADEAVRAAVPAAGVRLPIPDNVGQLIEARLATLSAPALRLARVAALADKDFSVELAAAVLGVHVLDLAEPWRELADAQVIRDESFAHDLVFEATRRSIPAALAQSLHATVARCLAQQGVAPERVARHFYSAEAWPQAAAAYLNAAEAALALSRRADELRLLQAAADCRTRARSVGETTAIGDAGVDFEIALRAARASVLIDRADVARGHAQTALDLSATDTQRAAALAACAETEEFLGDFETAIAHATEGLTLAQQLNDVPLELTHAAHLGRVFAMRGEFARGCAMFDAHTAGIDLAPESAAARAFLMHQAIVLDHARRRDEAVVAGERALRLAENAQDDSTACLCRIHLTSFHARMGAGDAAFEHATRAVQLREKIGQAGGQTEVAEVYLGILCASLGRFSQTLELLDTAQQRLGHGHAVSWAVMARGVLARTWMLLGQPARGLKLVADDTPGVTESVRGLRLVNLVRVLRALGKPRAEELAKARATFARQALHEGDLLVRLEEAIDAPAASAVRFAAEVELEAARRQHRALQMDAMTIGCGALSSAGAVQDAAAKARAMLDFAQSAICWTAYRGEVYWRAYEALAAAGHEREALDALQAGADWIDTTLAYVPEAFRDSFRNRNPVNRALLTTASRKLQRARG